RAKRFLSRRGKRDERLVEIKELEKRLTEMLAEGFPDTRVEVEFDPIDIGDFFTKGSRAYVHDGLRTEATLNGRGMERELMLAVVSVYAEYWARDDGANPKRVLAVGEPE